MNSDAVVVKVEPADDYETVSSANIRLNGFGGENNKSPESDKTGDNTSYHDTRNFTCLLCDVVCSCREDLRKHLKLLHTSKTYSAMSGQGGDCTTISPGSTTSSHVFSGYVNYRYTCASCGAKFKSFRTYLTHSMSHRSESGLHHVDEMRMAALFGTGKQYMQDYMETDDNFSGTFTCTECDTAFVQRDAYAMHMMMRAMNETCKQSVVSLEDESTVNNNENDKQESSLEVKENGVSNHTTEDENGHQQRCLEDVTAQVDQDEYLKSVLDKVYETEVSKPELADYHLDERKSCLFCKDNFIDQDSLAMHVMSDHAEEMTSAGSNARNNIRNNSSNSVDYMAWMTMASRPMTMNCICKYCNQTFMSRDSLALHVLTHAHLEEKLSEQARNIYKRKFDVVDTNTAFFRAKSSRYTHQPVHEEPTIRNKPSTSKYFTSLYCDECNIRFYAESEFDWHMRRHTEGKIASYAEPLCLTKENPKEILKDTPAKAETVEEREPILYKPRRNSFSCDLSVDVHQDDALPRRPVSVGDCSTETLKHLNKTANDSKRDGVVDGEGTRVTKENVLQTINALSSSEQRIIYSVFGKDLSLKVSKQEMGEDMRTQKPEPETHSNKVEDTITETHDKTESANEDELDKGDSILSANFKNGDQDGRQKLLNLEKDAPMCKFCEILFFNKAIYYLHMGLHNVNNPWQCNVCGKLCSNAVDFAAHVIHM